jgi:hypothetical protein
MTDRHDFSVGSARKAAERDELDAWVADFLSSPGSDNAPLASELSQGRRWWIGPVRLPFDRLHRLAGPEGEPVLCPVDEDDWGDRVDDMKEQVEEGWEPPPLIVSYRGGQLVLEDGNHRIESLRRTGADDAWAVVSFEDPNERDQFVVPEPA